MDSSDEDDYKSFNSHQYNDILLESYEELELKYNSVVQELNKKNKLYEKLLEKYKQLRETIVLQTSD